MSRVPYIVLMSLVVLTAGGVASADDAEVHLDTEGEHGDEEANHSFVGIKGAYLAAPHHGEVHHHLGGGAFFEVTLLPEALELEVCLKWMSAEHGFLLPLDIMLKVPFHVNEVLHPYIGVGPVAVLAVDEEPEGHFGGGAVGGAYFWLSDSVGLLAELTFNLLWAHGLHREFGGALGIVFGF